MINSLALDDLATQQGSSNHSIALVHPEYSRFPLSIVVGCVTDRSDQGRVMHTMVYISS